jgi:hypothetical protein
VAGIVAFSSKKTEHGMASVKGVCVNSKVLPDGMLSYQKCQFGYILECLAMKDVGKFYGHCVYFTDIWYT